MERELTCCLIWSLYCKATCVQVLYGKDKFPLIEWFVSTPPRILPPLTDKCMPKKDTTIADLHVVIWLQLPEFLSFVLHYLNFEFPVGLKYRLPWLAQVTENVKDSGSCVSNDAILQIAYFIQILLEPPTNV